MGMTRTLTEVTCDGGIWNAKNGDGQCPGESCKACGGTGILIKQIHNGVRTEGHTRGCLCSECA